MRASRAAPDRRSLGTNPRAPARRTRSPKSRRSRLEVRITFEGQSASRSATSKPLVSGSATSSSTSSGSSCCASSSADAPFAASPPLRSRRARGARAPRPETPGCHRRSAPLHARLDRLARRGLRPRGKPRASDPVKSRASPEEIPKRAPIRETPTLLTVGGHGVTDQIRTSQPRAASAPSRTAGARVPRRLRGSRSRGRSVSCRLAASLIGRRHRRDRWSLARRQGLARSLRSHPRQGLVGAGSPSAPSRRGPCGCNQPAAIGWAVGSTSV